MRVPAFAARRLELRMADHDDTVGLEIADDERGFDTARDFPGHLGLRSMPERARRLRGQLTIISRVGEGTRVRASMPTGVASRLT